MALTAWSLECKANTTTAHHPVQAVLRPQHTHVGIGLAVGAADWYEYSGALLVTCGSRRDRIRNSTWGGGRGGTRGVLWCCPGVCGGRKGTEIISFAVLCIL